MLVKRFLAEAEQRSEAAYQAALASPAYKALIGLPDVQDVSTERQRKVGTFAFTYRSTGFTVTSERTLRGQNRKEPGKALQLGITAKLDHDSSSDNPYIGGIEAVIGYIKSLTTAKGTAADLPTLKRVIKNLEDPRYHAVNLSKKQLSSLVGLEQAKLPKLNQVDLFVEHNALTDLQGCPTNLLKLFASNNQLTTVKGIASSIEWLYVDHNKLTDLADIALHCPNLKLVSVRHNPVKAQGILQLMRLPRLDTIWCADEIQAEVTRALKDPNRKKAILELQQWLIDEGYDT